MECNWKVGFSLEIPKDWVSGVYLGKLSTIPAIEADNTWICEMSNESYFVFVVRDDRKADLAVSDLRHDLAVLQSLAAMEVALRPRRECAMGR